MGMLPKEIDNPETPLYPIGVVADLLHVTEQTLRVYEKGGLITPCRRNRDRYYSANDIVWLQCLRRLIKEDGLNMKGIEKLLKIVPCYEVSPCDDCSSCTAHLKRGNLFAQTPSKNAIPKTPLPLEPADEKQGVALTLTVPSNGESTGKPSS
jgi:hypothetical protein